MCVYTELVFVMKVKHSIHLTLHTGIQCLVYVCILTGTVEMQERDNLFNAISQAEKAFTL